MTRFAFNIKTRSGQRVDNISLLAASEPDAQRRLRQMYQGCEILECHTVSPPRPPDALDMENVIGLISNEPPVIADASTFSAISDQLPLLPDALSKAPSGNKTGTD